MKKVIFILIWGMVSCIGFAQRPATNDTAYADSTQVDSSADHGEAGGIDAAQIAQNNEDNKETMNGLWTSLIAGALVVVGIGIGSYFGSRKRKQEEQKEISNSKLFIDESVAPQGASKEITAADVKKLKDEIKRLKKLLEESQNETIAYKNNLEVYTSFDQQYYNEAFRKLVSPMNDAMEKGSRKEIMESLLKIMSHFSSLTRYKISKKQPYDEANMQYLMNQKTKNDAAVEIDGNTPLDKIPKNIKTLVDMLSEQSSNGLDDAIISGYKIKNL